MNDKNTLLSVKDLKIHFPTDEGIVKAVDGISFDLYPGKTLGIVGESGCGKSTVGKGILNILEKPGRITGGNIYWNNNGENIDLASFTSDHKTLRGVRGSEIALVFQEPMTSFSPVHSVGSQIIEMIRLHKDMNKKEAKEWAMELFDMVGIPNATTRINDYAHQFSGGLRQRAMIAMAISCEPKLLIADEPTTALDVTTQAQILDLLQDLQEKHKMAMILITHNLGVVAEVCDDVVVMYLGRSAEKGPVDSIFHDSKHPYTRGLLESIPSINSKQGERLKSIVGTIPAPFNRPKGCTFHPRCPSYIKGVCDTYTPEYLPLVNNDDSRLVSCFLHHDPEKEVV
jgi:peptide/nickel transport system ATP-binding protein